MKAKNARSMSTKLCLTCKGGRMLCGQSTCPLLQKLTVNANVREKLSEDLFGPSQSIFVGWHSYPNVFVGPMTSLDENLASILDNPGVWYGKTFDDIIAMRSLLVRSKQGHGVFERNPFIDELQEISLSVKPVDIEAHFKGKPSLSLSFSAISQPMGPSGILKDLKVIDNPKIPRKVERVVADGLPASDSLYSLYRQEHDVYYLTNVLSSGALGRQDSRKLVPTRWSITAVDDIIGKQLMEDIRRFPLLNEFRVYRNTYLENHFDILIMPGPWEFEQFEVWAPRTLWTQSLNQPVIIEEHEGFSGRTDYALKEGGGYYAGRIGVAEGLHRLRRQAKAVIFREIYDTYLMPVGVWEVRENVRKAMNSQPKLFATLTEALADIRTHLVNPLEHYLQRSKILRQRRITEYL
jgi:hypothetical protein